jgi:hypothetical protein
MKPLLITGPMGGGMNHLRLLLGLGKGAEIRDLSGRRLPDADKEQFVLKIMYHDHRAYNGPLPERGYKDNLWKVEHRGYSWQAQSYWLRVEWLTRDLYTDSHISHDPAIDEGIRFVTKNGAENLICDLYKAKCPNLNGNTQEEQIKHTMSFVKIPTVALPVYLPDFYKNDWCDLYLQKLTTQLDLPAVEFSIARRIHQRWCELNHFLIKSKNL